MMGVRNSLSPDLCRNHCISIPRHVAYFAKSIPYYIYKHASMQSVESHSLGSHIGGELASRFTERGTARSSTYFIIQLKRQSTRGSIGVCPNPAARAVFMCLVRPIICRFVCHGRSNCVSSWRCSATHWILLSSGQRLLPRP